MIYVLSSEQLLQMIINLSQVSCNTFLDTFIKLWTHLTTFCCNSDSCKTLKQLLSLIYISQDHMPSKKQESSTMECYSQWELFEFTFEHLKLPDDVILMVRRRQKNRWSSEDQSRRVNTTSDLNILWEITTQDCDQLLIIVRSGDCSADVGKHCFMTDADQQVGNIF